MQWRRQETQAPLGQGKGSSSGVQPRATPRLSPPAQGGAQTPKYKVWTLEPKWLLSLSLSRNFAFCREQGLLKAPSHAFVRVCIGQHRSGDTSRTHQLSPPRALVPVSGSLSGPLPLL